MNSRTSQCIGPLVLGSRNEGELVARLVWRVKLVTEFGAGETSEVEVARIERDE